MPHPRLPTYACVFATLLTLTACNDTMTTPPDQPAATPASHNESAAQVSQTFNIEGMHCEGCVAAITAAVKDVEGVEDVQVSLDEKKATVRGGAPNAIAAAIESRGYTATPEAQ